MSEENLFSKRLKQARAHAGLSQRRLGILMDLEPLSASIRVNRYERGTRNPALQTTIRMAKILGVSPSFFYEPRDVLANIILVLGRKDDDELEELLEAQKVGTGKKSIT